MDDAVQNAINRRRVLEAELRDIDTFLTLHKRFAGTKSEKAESGAFDTDVPMHVLEKALAANTEYLGVFEKVAHHAAEALRTSRPRGRPADLARIMETIIKDANRPLSRSEIAAEMLKRGHEIPSDDKPRYLGTILWRNGDIFEQVEGRGYWLKGRPVPDIPIFGHDMDRQLGIKR